MASTKVSSKMPFNVKALDLSLSADAQARDVARAATHEIKNRVEPLDRLAALDMNEGDLLRSYYETELEAYDVEAYDTWLNISPMPKWDRYPLIEDFFPSVNYDPYQWGISALMDEQYSDCSDFRTFEEATMCQDWRQTIYRCEHQAHILVVASGCPLVVLTPAISDSKQDEQIRLLNAPPGKEDKKYLCGGRDLRREGWARHKKESQARANMEKAEKEKEKRERREQRAKQRRAERRMGRRSDRLEEESLKYLDTVEQRRMDEDSLKHLERAEKIRVERQKEELEQRRCEEPSCVERPTRNLFQVLDAMNRKTQLEEEERLRMRREKLESEESDLHMQPHAECQTIALPGGSR